MYTSYCNTHFQWYSQPTLNYIEFQHFLGLPCWGSADHRIDFHSKEQDYVDAPKQSGPSHVTHWSKLFSRNLLNWGLFDMLGLENISDVTWWSNILKQFGRCKCVVLFLFAKWLFSWFLLPWEVSKKKLSPPLIFNWNHCGTTIGFEMEVDLQECSSVVLADRWCCLLHGSLPPVTGTQMWNFATRLISFLKWTEQITHKFIYNSSAHSGTSPPTSVSNTSSSIRDICSFSSRGCCVVSSWILCALIIDRKHLAISLSFWTYGCNICMLIGRRCRKSSEIRFQKTCRVLGGGQMLIGDMRRTQMQWKCSTVNFIKTASAKKNPHGKSIF